MPNPYSGFKYCENCVIILHLGLPDYQSFVTGALSLIVWLRLWLPISLPPLREQGLDLWAVFSISMD
jgi:hypothetical protein